MPRSSIQSLFLALAITAAAANPGCTSSTGTQSASNEKAATATPGAQSVAPTTPATQPAATISPPPARQRRNVLNRTFSSRKLETIFSPLDLPTPTTLRTADGSPGPDYWQQQADYSINATLDDEHRVINATATITYTNNSPQPLDFVWVHLEQNVFKKDSLGTLSSVPEARFSSRSDFEGGITIKSVTFAGADLPCHVYDTVARLDLPGPITPKGGKLIFDIAWSFQIPSYGIDRMGIEDFEQGAVFEIAQWFPALCVFDDVHGWNTLPYLGQGEFYTNFGSFDVSLTVPHSHILAATGLLQNPADVLTQTEMARLDQARSTKETTTIIGEDEAATPETRPPGDAPLTWHFKADNARTFAWASSPAFIWDAAAVNGKPDILAQSMYPKEAKKTWSKSTDMLRFSIEHYSTMWFPYPYPIATNICGTVGGMEYPMIIFCGNGGGERGLYGVTTHEIGHNWFPMTVNTDERRHAWMDEGFNSFINIYSEMERFPSDDKSHEARGFARSMRMRGQPPMDTAADQLGPGLLGNLEYAKTAVALYLLREVVLGPERFDPAFRTYIKRWAFKSPQPADFYRTMENAVGMDLAWFWRGWFTENGALDQAVDSVRERSDSGVAIASFSNKGEMVMPLAFRVVYDDGSSEVRRLPVEIWLWTDRWTTQWDTEGRHVKEVVIDPDEVLPDTDTSNNTWKAPDPEKPTPDGKEPINGAAAPVPATPLHKDSR